MAEDPHALRTVVVVAGGVPWPDPAPGIDAVAVVAADSGVQHARQRGLRVDVAVGDMDSVDPTDLAAVEAAGAVVERHPPTKDASDLELALERALALDPERIVVLGGPAGRLDHLLVGTLALAAPALQSDDVSEGLAAFTEKRTPRFSR